MLSTLEVRSWGLRWDQAFRMSWSQCDSNDKHESVWNSLPCLNLNYVLLFSPLSYHVSYHSDHFRSIPIYHFPTSMSCMSILPIMPTRSLPAKVVMLCVILCSPWTSPRRSANSNLKFGNIWQPHWVRRGTIHFKELINECVKLMAQFDKDSIQPLEL